MGSDWSCVEGSDGSIYVSGGRVGQFCVGRGGGWMCFLCWGSIGVSRIIAHPITEVGGM